MPEIRGESGAQRHCAAMHPAGTGDRRHSLRGEAQYRFTTLGRLFANFESEVQRCLHEDSDS